MCNSLMFCSLCVSVLCIGILAPLRTFRDRSQNRLLLLMNDEPSARDVTIQIYNNLSITEPQSYGTVSVPPIYPPIKRKEESSYITNSLNSSV